MKIWSSKSITLLYNALVLNSLGKLIIEVKRQNREKIIAHNDRIFSLMFKELLTIQQDEPNRKYKPCTWIGTSKKDISG